MSEKRMIAKGAVTRCPHCNGSGKMVSTRTSAARAEICLRCLGHGNIVRFEAYEKGRV